MAVSTGTILTRSDVALAFAHLTRASVALLPPLKPDAELEAATAINEARAILVKGLK